MAHPGQDRRPGALVRAFQKGPAINEALAKPRQTHNTREV
jgi:hypothetical protein